jgi:hypothetical protein
MWGPQHEERSMLTGGPHDDYFSDLNIPQSQFSMQEK